MTAATLTESLTKFPTVVPSRRKTTVTCGHVSLASRVAFSHVAGVAFVDGAQVANILRRWRVSYPSWYVRTLEKLAKIQGSLDELDEDYLPPAPPVFEQAREFLEFIMTCDRDALVLPAPQIWLDPRGKLGVTWKGVDWLCDIWISETGITAYFNDSEDSETSRSLVRDRLQLLAA